MPTESIFNSAFFFENATYDDFQDNVYHSRKKSDREDFSRFLIENLKELEFRKKKNRKTSNISYVYAFEEDKKQKIKVIDDKEGIHIIAMYQNEANEDIDEEMVDRDNGETFQLLMDRVMDALEVVECKMFNLECKTKTNLNRTPQQIKTNKIKHKNEEDSDYEEEDDDDDDNDNDDEEDQNESSESEEFTVSKSKRKSVRIKNMKRKRKSDDDEEEEEEMKPTKRRSRRLKKPVITRNRKRKKMDDDDDSDNNDDDDDDDDEPKKKRRRINNSIKTKSEYREMKREFVKYWINNEYVEAVHCAEDDHNMLSEEINELIKDIYDNDL